MTHDDYCNEQVVKLANPEENRVDMAKSLFGIIPDDGMSIDEIKNERLKTLESVRVA